MIRRLPKCSRIIVSQIQVIVKTLKLTIENKAQERRKEGNGW